MPKIVTRMERSFSADDADRKRALKLLARRFPSSTRASDRT
jgi:hypothetical protein